MLGVLARCLSPRLIPEERSLLPQADSSGTSCSWGLAEAKATLICNYQQLGVHYLFYHPGASTHLHRAVAGTPKAGNRALLFLQTTSKISSSNLPRGWLALTRRPVDKCGPTASVTHTSSSLSRLKLCGWQMDTNEGEWKLASIQNKPL